MRRFARRLLHLLARQPLLRAIARRFFAPGMLRVLATPILPPPTPDHFRALLSETATTDFVPGRVVLVCGSLQPGGAERQVVNTLVGLDGSPKIESLTLLCEFLGHHEQNQYDFYLPLARQSGATIRKVGTAAKDIEPAQMPDGFHKIKSHLSPSVIADVTKLYQEFRVLRPQVVHAWLDWCNIRAGLAAVLAGVPRVLLSGRNLNPSHFALNADYYHPAYLALMERDPDNVVLMNNSQAGADDYAAWLSLPPGRIKVLRNGVHFADATRPSTEYCFKFRANLGVAEGAPLIGGMFRFNEEKRPLLWLKAAARVAQSRPDAHFVLFGQGDMEDQMKGLIRELSIETKCRFLGTVTPSFHGLSLCDVMLLTSRGEGTPNVLLEAQWLGVPVVTTDAGGAAEAVEDGVTGLVVRTDEEVAIADAVLRILEDTEFRSLARTAGPAFISTRYGMERMINETLAAYGLDVTDSRAQKAQL